MSDIENDTPPPSPLLMGPDQKEIVLLNILAGMGGRTDAGDYPWSWLNWFCNDETERGGTDTFNRCEAKGWINTTHDSDSDHSTTTLTAAGRAIVLASPRPAPAEQMAGALALIAAERKRQITKGYDAAHDDLHKGGEIVTADWGARARIEAAINAGRSGDSPAYKELLAEAAAQCLAEIERVERAEGKANA